MVLSRDHNEDETKQSSNTLSHIIHREIHLVTLLVLFSFPSSFGNYCNGQKTRLFCVNCVRGSDGRWYYDVPGKENSTKQAQMLFILFLIRFASLQLLDYLSSLRNPRNGSKPLHFVPKIQFRHEKEWYYHVPGKELIPKQGFCPILTRFV